MLDCQACLSRSQQNIIDLNKWQEIADLISELFDSACGTIVQFRQNEFNVVVASQNEDNFLSCNDTWPWDMNSFCRRIIETQKGLDVQQAKLDNYWKYSPAVLEGKVRSYCGLPIFWPSGELFGTICVIDTKATNHSSVLIKLLAQFGRLIAADLKMLRDYQDIRDLALTDDLTGINNRRGLSFLGEQRIKEARRSKQTIGFIYLDIDHLKWVNDEHGHQIGDECIIILADAIKVSGRESDIIARLGGDEFIIMTSFCDGDEYMQHLENLSLRIFDFYSSSVAKYDINDSTSISYGYCVFKHEQMTLLDEMIQQTDQLMYQNKNSKR